MIPLRDVIPSRSTPYITVTIIALNAVAWLFELSLPHETLNEFLTVYGVVPAYFSAPTLITSMFLHGSWSHVLGNMWYLWIFGDNVEDRVGHGRFIVFYLLCGIAAAAGQVAVDPNSTLPTIGASGAIAGVLGAYFVLLPRARVLTLIFFGIILIREIQAYWFLGIWIALQIVTGGLSLLSPNHGGGTAFFAHIGGFVFGLATVLLVARRRPEVPSARFPVY
jgi:membrane associated rhomboid family serine protease